MSDYTQLQNTQVDSNEDQSFAAEEFFSKQWQIYQKVLNNNYMYHQEIYHVLQELLQNYFDQPFTMLELGCGDARFTTQALLNTKIAQYTAIDVSIPALQDAEKNLAKINCPANFITGDCWQLTDELAANHDQKFDVILISLALHHLQLEEKDHIIYQLKTMLNSGGIFILIDVTRKEHEDRNTYLKRYMSNVAKYWNLLTPEEYTMFNNHICSSDFPETATTLKAISDKHGFSNFSSIYCDPLEINQLLCFYK
ncbi:class I SAM-dependent methyltransferase [Anabaena sp. FACHB-1237]|uniref:class I SAM-dependent methyltransferase n=1 Tax=Anabaena sp. FACHB-1237 TaxID=2692769 RepID=UPI001680BF0D|nr:class I SAM-dependent methyltransferase [Anabaena sp. FACHB-1237]MBD2139370.1 class I SAM-dependent methyltransferase [Anabaena sp. FACHB-1237]